MDSKKFSSAILVALWWFCSDSSYGVERKVANIYFGDSEASLEAAIRADDRAAIAVALGAGANVNARGIHNITPIDGRGG